MSRIELHRGLIVAQKVLAALRKLPVKSEVAVHTYDNCREQGYCFQCWGKSPRYALVAECRNSDSIFVGLFEGTHYGQGRLPGEAEWQDGQRFIEDGQYGTAANLIREWLDNGKRLNGAGR